MSTREGRRLPASRSQARPSVMAAATPLREAGNLTSTWQGRSYLSFNAPFEGLRAMNTAERLRTVRGIEPPVTTNPEQGIPPQKSNQMKYRTLGSSGLIVSRITLGTMTFG